MRMDVQLPGAETQAGEQLTLAKPNKANAAVLVVNMSRLVSGEPIIDIIAAAGTVIANALEDGSRDLPTALSNMDRLSDDIKDMLRKRLCN